MILYVLRYWPTRTETFVHDEIRAVAAAGRAVELAAFDPREGSADDPPAPVHPRPHRWGWLPWLGTLIVEALRGPARPRVLWLAALLRRRAARQAHVHFAGEAAVDTRAACARVGIPYSVTVHAADLFKPHPALGETLRAAAAVATISEHNRRVLADRYGVAAAVVRCGVSVPAASGAAPDSEAGPRVLAVGRWVPKKGLDLYATLPAALAAAVPGARFDLVSDAPALPGVTVHGLLPHAEVLARIAAADLVVLPCRRAPDGDLDGIPVVLLEALAAGVPVVTTDVSGIPEVIDAEVGWVVPPDDAPALVAAVTEALRDPGERRRRGAAGPARLRARGFDRATATAAVLEILDRAARS